MALRPSDALRTAAQTELRKTQTANRYADRIAQVRCQDSETPSETRLLEDALTILQAQSCSVRPAVRRTDELLQRRAIILHQLYPVHSALSPVLTERTRVMRRQHLLKSSLRDHKTAMKKLRDGANLLLLVADHARVLANCYGSCCSFASVCSGSEQSGSDFGSEDDVVRGGCLGGRNSDESRRSMFISSVPSTFRIRYLRKCWGYAADALAAAVECSTFLLRELERLGQKELIAGLEAQCRRCMWLLELPGGLTVLFRTDSLLKMANQARVMRSDALQWYDRLRAFVLKMRKEHAKGKRKLSALDDRLVDLRQDLLAEEFRDVLSED